MWTLVTFFGSFRAVLRPAAVLGILLFSASIFAEEVTLLKSSTVRLKPGATDIFDAKICLAEAGEPLANRKLELGIVHPLFDGNDQIIYQFEQSLNLDKVYGPWTDAQGCVVISDRMIYGEYGQLPSSNYRGRLITEHDPLAERIYGIRFPFVKGLIILHIQMNRGLPIGRAFIEVLK